jgi:hypothetical protein
MIKHRNIEGRIQLQIIHYLRMKGYVVGKTKTKGTQKGRRWIFDLYTFRGFPDLVCFTPKLYFLEIKGPAGVQSPEQKEFQQLATKASIPYILARSVQDVMEGIQ